RRHLLVVVEDQGEGRLQAAVELAEKAPGEDGESLNILWSQQRQRAAAPGSRLSDVVEEGRDVSVARVHLIPEAAHSARRQIARDEGRLTRPWWPAHPGDWPRPGAIERAEESRPRDRPRHSRPNRLREGHSFRPRVRLSLASLPMH